MPRFDHLDEPSSTPDRLDGDVDFTVTHPFHPLFKRRFSLLAQRLAWGESRVFFHDPTTGYVRSLPTAWTDLAPIDPFVHLATGQAILRLSDLQSLVGLLTLFQERSHDA